MKLYADQSRLLLNNWNIGHGNKISHLFFLINLANKIGAEPIIPLDSSLDDIFDLSRIKNQQEKQDSIDCLFEEVSAFSELSLLEKVSLKLGVFPIFSGNLIKSLEKSRIQAGTELNLLDGTEKFTEAFIRGHFWHYDIMPSKKVFDKYIKVKPDLLKKCREKYPDLELDKSVVVHLRDTDFKGHLPHVFKKPIALPDEYYYKAIDACEKELGEDGLTYHLFSDNHDRISHIFRDKKTVLHTDSAEIDWVSIFLGRKVIQSNSTFCWTASLFKEFSIQPNGGYNWYFAKKGDMPYGFKMPFSKIIDTRI